MAVSNRQESNTQTIVEEGVPHPASRDRAGRGVIGGGSHVALVFNFWIAMRVTRCVVWMLTNRSLGHQAITGKI